MKMTQKQHKCELAEPKDTQLMQSSHCISLDLPERHVLGEAVGTDKVGNWVLAAKDTLRSGKIFVAAGTRELERRY